MFIAVNPLTPLGRRALWPLIERWYGWLALWCVIAAPVSWAGAPLALILAVATTGTLVAAFWWHKHRVRNGQ